MDNGANGGMAGDDVLVTAYRDHDCAQVTGIGGNIYIYKSSIKGLKSCSFVLLGGGLLRLVVGVLSVG